MLNTQLFPPEWRGKYTHMFPYDVEVWERFLDKYGSLYNGFYYDVMCGEESERFPHWEENYIKDATTLSRLRIDAVGDKNDAVDIIEIKPRGNMASMGQLLTYKEHYVSEYKPEKPVRMVLVCGTIDPNIIPILEKNGVNYIVV